jgi:soluble lytic murein transglycosylase-like protein
VSLIAAAVMAGTVNCWAAAAYRYQLPTELLYAMGSVESSHAPTALAVANDGTYSVGLMQINSSWFTKLERHGIEERQLWDPCTNIQVGAWILRQEVDRYGYSWEAIGAYYAGAYNEKNYRWKISHYRAYATKVLDRWHRIREVRKRSTSSPVAAARVNSERAGP